jgi:transposase-like protein
MVVNVDVPIETPIICPKCQNTECCKSGFSAKTHKQRYLCNKCKAQFVLSPILKPIIQRNINCPTCNKTHIQKCGLTKAGTQKYVCADCNRRFVLNPCVHIRTPKLKEPRETKEHHDKGYLNKRELAEEKALILFTHKAQNVDSLIDVPCFACEFQEKQECNPKTCTALDQYLISGTTIKLMPIPREEPIPQNAWYTFK